MAVFKCKMCGGTLEIQNNASVAICEYCGTQQTLPKLDSDRKANMYDRANYFRRNNEFDAAMGIYEQILAEDNTDAESYWSLVLCRYGIEYVEDPNSHKRIPTVNRAQFTSIFADADYKNAIKNADSLQKKVYEQEAKTIDEIQKGILAISEKEEPFDVFICYKETDSLGRRTVDSVIAMDIYKELTKEGYKVFFSRVTLEDKLGQEYEPYIFAALNSAKAMIVLGTKTEYFDAVWVKNEWSRYLSLIKNGEKKTLIPAYRDISPYDLPKEFAYLQAQDMGKIGFMQDLVYGIQKIIPLDKNKSTAMPMTDTSGNLTELFLTNAVVALENGDFKGADTYCDKVLKTDSKNAQAYLYKMMVELSVRKEEDLAKCSVPFDKNENYKKAVQYGDKTLTLRLQGYIDQINEHIEKQKKAQKRMTKIGIIAASSVAVIALAVVATVNFIIPGVKYSKANGLFDEGRYEEAISAFEALDGFGNSEKRILDCKFEMAMDLVEAGKFDEAIAAFEALGNFNGSTEQIENVESMIESQRIAMLDEIYNKGIALMNEEKYTEALAVFNQITGHKDANDLITTTREKMYAQAKALADAHSYNDAYQMLKHYDANDSLTIFCKAMVDGRYGDAVKVGKLIEFTVPQGVKEIKADAFKGCTTLEKIILTDGIETIGASAFQGCTSLASIDLPDSITAIGNNSFKDCTALQKITLSDGIETIGIGAFQGCTALMTINLPDSVTVIGNGAFKGCNQLESVDIPSNLQTLGTSVFINCSNLTTVYYMGNFDEWLQVNKGGSFINGDTKFYIYSESQTLKDYDFWYNADGQRTIVNTESHYGFMFALLPSGNEYTVQSVGEISGTKIVIPPLFKGLPITKIDMKAFNSCRYTVTEIIFPETLRVIDQSVFYGMRGLISIIFPNSVVEVGKNAFEGCTSLKKVVLSENMSIISEYMFAGCKNLKEVVIPKRIHTISSKAFQGCSNIVWNYKGTKEDWNNILKLGYVQGYNTFRWDTNISGYTVRCTDGDITK